MACLAWVNPTAGVVRGVAVCSIAVLFSGCLSGCSSTAPASRSARELFREAIHVLSTQPLGRERVDWARVAAELEITVASDAPLTAAYPLIQNAVGRLGDRHSRFVPPPRAAPPVVATQPASASPATNGSTPKARGEIPYSPSARLLDQRIAYVVVPLCAASERAALLEYATELRRAIALVEREKPQGWLVELRFDGGGNVWPMLLGLWPLLGDGVQLTGIAPNGDMTYIGCEANASWMERDNQPRVDQLRFDAPAADAPIASTPVAVLIGPWTLSAGEMMAVSFRGKPRTRLFGEPSGGFTTATNEFPLFDGSKLVLSVEAMGDRTGRRVPHRIPPDQAIEIGDWPTVQDEVAQAAIAWLLSESTERP